MGMTMHMVLTTGIITPSIATCISSNCFSMDCGPLAMAYPLRYPVSKVVVQGQGPSCLELFNMFMNFVRPVHCAHALPSAERGVPEACLVSPICGVILMFVSLRKGLSHQVRGTVSRDHFEQAALWFP